MSSRSVLARTCLVVALVSSCATSDSEPAGGSVPDGVPAPSEPAVVVRIVDGDTVMLRGDGTGLVPSQETRVRLLEIDTPESVVPDQPVECYGPESTEALEELLPVRSQVWVLPDRELMDPYDRMLLYLWNDDGEFVNLEMVRSGAAAAVLFEPNDRYIDLVRRAEREARVEGRGMWGAC